jgi:hypothetical protein
MAFFGGFRKIEVFCYATEVLQVVYVHKNDLHFLSKMATSRGKSTNFYCPVRQKRHNRKYFFVIITFLY